MKYTKKDLVKFLELENKVEKNICDDINNSELKKCKTEEDKQKLKEEMKKFKRDVL